MIATVVEARQRVYGLSPAHAAFEEATDELGRLYLAGALRRSADDNGRDRYEAGRAWQETVSAYNRVMDARTLRNAIDGYAPEYVAWAAGVRSRYDTGCRAMRNCGEPWAPYVVGVIVDGYSLPGWESQLQAGLDALRQVL